jgi:hypothetical protein
MSGLTGWYMVVRMFAFLGVLFCAELLTFSSESLAAWCRPWKQRKRLNCLRSLDSLKPL